MKKMLKNKKGFTLIELLAVIVVLAIIMVIATQQVTKAIDTARESSFESSFKMIVKEVKNRVAEKQLGHTVTITCDEADSDLNKKCSKIYDISAADYNMKITDDGNSYNIEFVGAGDKFGKFTGNAAKSASVEY